MPSPHDSSGTHLKPLVVDILHTAEVEIVSQGQNEVCAQDLHCPGNLFGIGHFPGCVEWGVGDPSPVTHGDEAQHGGGGGGGSSPGEHQRGLQDEQHRPHVHLGGERQASGAWAAGHPETPYSPCSGRGRDGFPAGLAWCLSSQGFRARAGWEGQWAGKQDPAGRVRRAGFAGAQHSPWRRHKPVA